MLRLWPKRLYAGLFGQHAWLVDNSRNQPLPASGASAAGASLAESLDAMLHTASFARGANTLSVMLPSHSARCVSLPWSRNLRGAEEKHAYALAHLEQAGMGTGDGHVVHAEFRHFGARGFAYAVPQQTLDELHEVAARHHLELTTVIPIAGVAHLAAARARGTGLDVSLIAEDSSISALAVSRTGLHRYDAEPAIGGQCPALMRLLTRLAADGVEFNGINLCADSDGAELAKAAGTFALEAPVQTIIASQWRRYL